VYTLLKGERCVTNEFNIPSSIKERINELDELVANNPVSISVPDAAAFLGMKPEGLRSSIDKGSCPFGISWQISPTAMHSYKIPTVTFYLWYTQGVGYKK
jgi:hypothetical protein